MSDKNFPASSPDSSKPILSVTTQKGDKGDPAVHIAALPSVIPVPTDENGNNPDLTGAVSNIKILEAGQIVADEISNNSWSAVVDSVTGGTGSVTGLIFTLETITADTGIAYLTLSKTGYSDIKTVIVFYKAYKGDKGDTGDTGSTGSQGNQGASGPAGNDGTGLVVLKFDIGVKAPVNPTVSNNGSGKVRLTFGAAHGLVLGEIIAVSDGVLGIGTESAAVTSVVNTTVVDTDITYTADGTVDFWTMRQFRRGGTRGSLVYSTPSGQILKYPSLLPIGAKLDQLAVIKISGTDSARDLILSAGYAAYSSSGYNSYLLNQNLNLVGAIKQVDLYRVDRSDYQISFLKSANVRRNLYLYGTTYQGSTVWDDYSAENYELFISYKYFNTSYTS